MAIVERAKYTHARAKFRVDATRGEHQKLFLALPSRRVSSKFPPPSLLSGLGFSSPKQVCGLTFPPQRKSSPNRLKQDIIIHTAKQTYPHRLITTNKSPSRYFPYSATLRHINDRQIVNWKTFYADFTFPERIITPKRQFEPFDSCRSVISNGEKNCIL